MRATVTVESPVVESPRVAQLRGLFDLPAGRTSRLEWVIDLPLDQRPWSIGLITGPSGCGKSTVARRLWPAELARSAALDWPAGRALVDAFPAGLSSPGCSHDVLSASVTYESKTGIPDGGPVRPSGSAAERAGPEGCLGMPQGRLRASSGDGEHHLADVRAGLQHPVRLGRLAQRQ